MDYYALHDPFVLQNIEIQPYLNSIKKLRKNKHKEPEGPTAEVVNKIYPAYESEYSKYDFTKLSIKEKL